MWAPPTLQPTWRLLWGGNGGLPFEKNYEPGDYPIISRPRVGVAESTPPHTAKRSTDITSTCSDLFRHHSLWLDRDLRFRAQRSVAYRARHMAAGPSEGHEAAASRVVVARQWRLK